MNIFQEKYICRLNTWFTVPIYCENFVYVQKTRYTKEMMCYCATMLF